MRVSGGTPDIGATGATRDAWRARSLAAGWVFPEDWWSPAVDAMTYAVDRGADLTDPCTRLGHARAQAGVGIGETLEDLGALFAAVGRDIPPMACVRALAEGWVEAGMFGLSDLACEDPLTGLATLPYLRTRMAEIYRGDRAPHEAYCLVVVDLATRLDPWKRIAWTIVIGHELRRTYPGEETLTLLGAGRAAALVPLRPELEFVTTRLRRDVSARHGARVWVERLPEDAAQAALLLDCLTEPHARSGP
ncbi:MAG TPA: hypothetical protein VGL93_10205 [Streptosporangiaceae bacterium]|jgi:hypothetical protein